MENEILADLSPLFRQYKSGRVERLDGTVVADAAPVDDATGVSARRVVIDPSIPLHVCLYLPPDPSPNLPILVYFHGGAFCVGSAFSPTYHPHLTALSARARLLVVSVDYRLAPEHPLPAAYDDCWAALLWVISPRADPWIRLHGDQGRIFLAGDSAGANIAHRVAVRAGREGVVGIEGAALVHPYFWGSEPVGREGREEGWRRWMDDLWRMVSGGEKGVDHEWINPAAEGDGAVAGMGCRRLLVCVAERDPMRERGMAYYEMVRRSGWRGEAELVETEGESHIFHLEKPEGHPKVQELTDKLVSFFSKPS